VLAGSGSLSVLWAVSSGVAVSMALAKLQGFYTFPQMAELVIVGFRELIGVATILALALAIGAVCRELGTGPWVAATVSPWINAVTAAPLVFIASGFIAFSTGTSWGTWAIMFPIAIPVAATLGASVPLMTAAVLGGGVFGDHCSPISDTTVVSSLSAGVDHIEHVVTQIPYALVGGTAAMILYFAAGLMIG
jgi:Na+/H+ antiporter NhaC